ncbi:hypothetical protein TB2_003248 [Malus domestica]
MPDRRHMLLRHLHRPRQCRHRNWVLIRCSINNISSSNSNWGLDRFWNLESDPFMISSFIEFRVHSSFFK